MTLVRGSLGLTDDRVADNGEEGDLAKRLDSWLEAALVGGGVARIPWRILEQMKDQALFLQKRLWSMEQTYYEEVRRASRAEERAASDG